MLSVIRQLDILLYPPAINILLLLAALLLWKKRRLALTLVSVALASLLLFSLPVVSRQLLAGLEVYPAIPPQALTSKKAQAIVVLGGGVFPNVIEYGGATLGVASYERLRYTAFIQRRTGLPILASGGYHLSEDFSEADIVKQQLATDFGIRNVWVEGNSRTTRDNAVFSAQILQQRGIQHIFLVTQSHHMKRAADLFRQQGLSVVPAPTAMAQTGPYQWQDFLPTGMALQESRAALHEYLGRMLSFL